MPEANINAAAVSAGEIASAASRESRGIRVRYTVKPRYETVAILGKTVESAGFAGTADRETMKRVYVTEDTGFDGSQVIVDGVDEYGIRTVEAAEATVSIAFVGDDKAHIPATWKLKGFKAKSAENDGVDFFVGEEMADKLAALLRTADAVSVQNPQFAGLWKVVDVNTGDRVFIRAIAPVEKDGHVCRR